MQREFSEHFKFFKVQVNKDSDEVVEAGGMGEL